ncbi:VanZ family protein [Candidatus Woesearchaeota archaeon]|nr:VanZ family protein [Candidatus Woesearchaeota archaeon]
MRVNELKTYTFILCMLFTSVILITSIMNWSVLLESEEDESSIKSFINLEKLAPPTHLVGYFILTSLWFFYFVICKVKNPFSLAITIGMFIGMSTEVIQFFLPYRFFDFWDIIINFAGALTSGIFYHIFFDFRKRFYRLNKK